MSTGKRNVGVEKVEKTAVRRLKRIYVMLNVAGVTVDVLSRGLGADWIFELSLTILSSRLGRIGSKKLWYEKFLFGWKKEKDLLNCKYKVTFQSDECAEPASLCSNAFYFFWFRPSSTQYPTKGLIFIRKNESFQGKIKQHFEKKGE